MRPSLPAAWLSLAAATLDAAAYAQVPQPDSVSVFVVPPTEPEPSLAFDRFVLRTQYDRARRVQRAGWVMIGLWGGTVAVGGGGWALAYEDTECDFFCLDSPGIRIGIVAFFSLPVLVTGVIVTGVGRARRNRFAPLIEPTVSADRVGMRIRF